MDLVRLMGQRCVRIGNEEILQVMVDMRRFVAGWLARDVMAVDDERAVATLMPGVQPKAGYAGLFHGLAFRRLPEMLCGFVMPAWLQPAADGDVIDQQGLGVIG